ncbi:hypothetical protein M5K25_003881 [Dendrobium thyrsiflorum]|uniref:CCHC-type domain-containing protein n=1 Tax=Dendrobium thyrsiflorum TaxID=117978 RepID=A0ABD0VSL7_DENTH
MLPPPPSFPFFLLAFLPKSVWPLELGEAVLEPPPVYQLRRFRNRLNGRCVHLPNKTFFFTSIHERFIFSGLVRFPHLPLQYWDETNITNIVSKVGSPILLDGNMFKWGRREFARACVRINFDSKLPAGIWVEGLNGRFFQKIEYEKISSFCYHCGKIGHCREVCSELLSNGGDVCSKEDVNKSGPDAYSGRSEDKSIKEGNENAEKVDYGPWIHVKFPANRRKQIRSDLNVKNLRSKSLLIADSGVMKGNADAISVKNLVEVNKKLAEHSKSTLNMKLLSRMWKMEGSLEYDFPDALMSINEDAIDPGIPEDSSVYEGDIKESILRMQAGSDTDNLKDAAIPGGAQAEQIIETEGKPLPGDAQATHDVIQNAGCGSNKEGTLLSVDSGKNSDLKTCQKSVSLCDNKIGSLSVKQKLDKELKSLGSIEEIPRKRKETKLSSIDRREVNRLIGVEWNFFHRPARSMSGGILVLWKRDDVQFTVVEDSHQFVFGVIQIPNMGNWNVTTVYGNKDLHVRRALWDSLERLTSSDIPFVVGGDFNCIISKEDKRGGKRYIFSQGPQEMRSFMANNNFHDVGVLRPKFTWCNNKDGASRIFERLDKCLLNSTVLQWIPLAKIRHLARVASDHSPIMFKSMKAIVHDRKLSGLKIFGNVTQLLGIL